MVVGLGLLAGCAIVGAEATFLRVLPTTLHLLLAVAVGVGAILVSLGLQARLRPVRDGK
jgi:hypothetical protein